MKHSLRIPSILKRWMIFNSVGAMGIAVQMGVLIALTSGAGLNYLAAAAIAVEAAVLHNFFWHERWTWADRFKNDHRGLLRRLLGFHLANGAFSLVGNIFLMHFFVERLHWHYVLANASAITLCSVFNFMAGDRLVFRARESPPGTGETKMRHLYPFALWPMVLFLGAFMPNMSTVQGAQLRTETLDAWHAYVETTEQRIARELSSSKGFLAMDFQEPSEAARERRAVLSGEIPVRPVTTLDRSGRPIEIPGGAVHHWRGAVFIPGIRLEDMLERLENPTALDAKQEDVLESRILEKTPGRYRIYLKLQRSKIVIVRYNTEHLVQYRRQGSDRAVSTSVATRIAEIEKHQGGGEQERAEGHDRGFLWRMNSYWRYERVSGGVLVECESLTLSRSIPPILEYLARPLINSVAHESMQRTLQCMRARMMQLASVSGVADATRDSLCSQCRL